MDEPGRPDGERAWPAELQSAAILASVERLAGLGVWVHDVSSDETWFSEQAKDIHGIDAAEHPSIDEIGARYAGDDSEAFAECVAGAIEQAEPFELDVRVGDESTRWQTLRVRCEPQTADGDVQTLHGTVEDVTDTTRREQRIEVLRQTSETLREANSRQAVAEELAQAAENILGLVNTAVRLIDERGETLETVVVTEGCIERAGERPDYPVDGESPAAEVYRSGTPQLYPDVVTVDDWDRGELVSGIYVPIGEHGVLSAGDVVYDAFDEPDLEATSLLGELGAEALTRIGWANRSRAV